MGAVLKRWTPEEDAYLQAHRSDPAAVAARFGRTLSSVKSRLQYPNRSKPAPADPVERKVTEEFPELPPPAFVIRERSIRLSIVPKTLTSAALKDPVAGYSALDTKLRKLSVQDALEICALHNGKPGDKIALAAMYSTTTYMIDAVISGRFFDRLDPNHPSYRKEM